MYQVFCMCKMGLLTESGRLAGLPGPKEGSAIPTTVSPSQIPSLRGNGPELPPNGGSQPPGSETLH